MNALLWLQEYNLLYCDIVINYNMLKSMLDDFFHKKTLFTVIILNQDSTKYEKYRANFDNNNNKKELEYMLKMAEIKNIGFLHSYIYIDVNKARQNLYI